MTDGEDRCSPTLGCGRVVEMSIPTAVGLAALEPQPMTAEQIADLVERVRAQQNEGSMRGMLKRRLQRKRIWQARRDQERIEYTRRVLDQMAAEAQR